MKMRVHMGMHVCVMCVYVHACVYVYKHHNPQGSSRELNSVMKHMENHKGFRNGRLSARDKEPTSPWFLRIVRKGCPEKKISRALRCVQIPLGSSKKNKPFTQRVKDNDPLPDSAPRPAKTGKPGQAQWEGHMAAELSHN